MIRKKRGKQRWAVYSEDGKKLSKWYRSKKKARQRLHEIEFFKHANGGS